MPHGARNSAEIGAMSAYPYHASPPAIIVLQKVGIAGRARLTCGGSQRKQAPLALHQVTMRQGDMPHPPTPRIRWHGHCDTELATLQRPAEGQTIGGSGRPAMGNGGSSVEPAGVHRRPWF
jgi:hypothetical protein